MNTRLLTPLLLLGLAACDPLGPRTPTNFTVVHGVVTSKEDGAPVAGARVFAHKEGWVSYSGDYVRSDTVRTDANGAYRLVTEHFCPAALIVVHDSLGMNRLPNALPCGTDGSPLRRDIAFEAVEWCIGLFGVGQPCGGGAPDPR